MSELDELPMRDLAQGEETDFPVGTLRLGETEHGCCYDVAIRRLGVFERGDGSRLQMWNLVAEFTNRQDAETCLLALRSAPPA